MTAVNWWLQPRGVLVMTDSLLGRFSSAAKGIAAQPAAFVQKAFPIVHLDAVLSGRGDADLIAAWANQAATRVLARDFDALCDRAPDLLRRLANECWLRRGSSYQGTTSIFAWGWSARAQRVVGFAYRSGGSYEPERMQDCLVFAPAVSNSRADLREAFKDAASTPAAMLDVMKQQHLEARISGGEAIVGGDVLLTTLTATDDGKVDIGCSRIFRFDTFDADHATATALDDL